MLFHLNLLRKLVVTNITFEQFLTLVNASIMFLEYFQLNKVFATYFTPKWLLSFMHWQRMSLHVGFCCVEGITNLAFKWFLYWIWHIEFFFGLIHYFSPRISVNDCWMLIIGSIQVLRHQRGGWVGSENGNFWWFTVL